MYLNEDGTFAENWTEELPEDLREYAGKLDVPDFPALVKKTMHAESRIGKDKVVVPTKDSSEAEWDAWYRAIGKPDTADDYKIEIPEELEGHYDPEFLKSLQQWAFEHHVPAGLFTEFMAFDAERAVAGLAEQARAAETEKLEAEGALRKEFGQAYEDRMHNARRLLHEFAPDTTHRTQILEKYGNDPGFIRLVSDIANKMIDSEILRGELPSAPTPKQADERLAEINATPGFLVPFADGPNKGLTLKETDAQKHEALLAESDQLVQEAYLPSQAG
jgi:hypothetical protein